MCSGLALPVFNGQLDRRTGIALPAGNASRRVPPRGLLGRLRPLPLKNPQKIPSDLQCLEHTFTRMQPLMQPALVEHAANQIVAFNRSVFSDLLWKEGDLFGSNTSMEAVVKALTKLLSQMPKDANRTEPANPVSDSQLDRISKLNLTGTVREALAESARAMDADVVPKIISAVEAASGVGSTPDIVVSGLMFALSSFKYEDLERMGEAWPSVQAAITDALLSGFLESAPKHLKSTVPNEVTMHHLDVINNLPTIIRAEGGGCALEHSAMNLGDRLGTVPASVPATSLISRNVDVQADCQLIALMSAILLMPKYTSRSVIGMIKDIISESETYGNDAGEGERLLRRLMILAEMSPDCVYQMGRQALIDLVHFTVQPAKNAEFTKALKKLPCEMQLTQLEIDKFVVRLVRPPHVSKWAVPSDTLWDSDNHECAFCLEDFYQSDLARLREYAAPQRRSQRPKLGAMREANVDINYCGHYFHRE